jgi:hypothetical protein
MYSSYGAAASSWSWQWQLLFVVDRILEKALAGEEATTMD